MSVMSASPSGLRSLSRDLSAQANALHMLGQSPGDIGLWVGLAALEQRSREDQWATQVQRCAPVLDEMAAGVAGFAGVVESLQDQWQTWDWRLQGWKSEVDRLRALMIGAEPSAQALLQRRLDELRANISTGYQALNDLEEAFRRDAATLASTVDDSLPSQLIREGMELYGLFQSGKKTATGLARMAIGSTSVTLAVRIARSVDDVARSSLLEQAKLLGQQAQRMGVPARVPLRFVPVVSVISTASSAVPDVMNGNGYTGWRGTTTRVLAGLAIPGSVALSIPTPISIGLGSLAVGAYTAWLGGNAVYDNRATIARYAERGMRQVAPHAAKLVAQLPQIEEDLDEAGDWLADNLFARPDPGEVSVPISTPIPGLRVPVNVPIPSLPEVDLDDLNIDVPSIPDWGDYLGPAPDIPILPEVDVPPLLPLLNSVPEALIP